MPERTGSADEPRHTHRSTHRITRGVAAALAVTAVLLVVGVVALVMGTRGTPGSPQPAADRADGGVSVSAPPFPTDQPSASPGQGGTPTVGSRAGSPSPSATANKNTGKNTDKNTDKATGGGITTFLEASEPTSIEIPSIGVRSNHFVPLTIQGDGTISVPGTAQEVGIYDAGPTPGQLGPSVLAAHVDTPSGVPGIFYDLGKVRAGDVVKVARQDGSRLTFAVDRVAAYRKSQFPTELVYKGDFTKSEIRLVTCGGPTDDRNEYRDNDVVFGHLTGNS